MVSLLSTEILAMVSSEPLNSTEWLSTSLLNRPHSAMMTSFPVTPIGKVPVRVTCATGGVWNQLLPVAKIDAASVLTRGVPNALIPPYMLLWLSEATHNLPGQTNNSSTWQVLAYNRHSVFRAVGTLP
jgi:hypothetical protein